MEQKVNIVRLMEIVQRLINVLIQQGIMNAMMVTMRIRAKMIVIVQAVTIAITVGLQKNVMMEQVGIHVIITLSVIQAHVLQENVHRVYGDCASV